MKENPGEEILLKIFQNWEGDKEALRYHINHIERFSKIFPHKGAVSQLAGYHVLTISPGRAQGSKGTREAASPHPHPRAARRAPPSSLRLGSSTCGGTWGRRNGSRAAFRSLRPALLFGSPRRLAGLVSEKGTWAHSPCGRATLGQSPVPRLRNAEMKRCLPPACLQRETPEAGCRRVTEPAPGSAAQTRPAERPAGACPP